MDNNTLQKYKEHLNIAEDNLVQARRILEEETSRAMLLDSCKRVVDMVQNYIKQLRELGQLLSTR